MDIWQRMDLCVCPCIRSCLCQALGATTPHFTISYFGLNAARLDSSSSSASILIRVVTRLRYLLAACNTLCLAPPGTKDGSRGRRGKKVGAGFRLLGPNIERAANLQKGPAPLQRCMHAWFLFFFTPYLSGELQTCLPTIV